MFLPPLVKNIRPFNNKSRTLQGYLFIKKTLIKIVFSAFFIKATGLRVRIN
jgi:hypothetical protein